MKNYQETLMFKEINETPEIFSKIYNENLEEVNKICKIVKERGIKSVYAVARGTSDHALIYFKYLLETLCGIPVTLGACSIVTLYNGKLNLKDTLVIGCSQSGKAVDVLEVLKRAKAQGGVTLTITNDRESPMAKFSDYHLYCRAGAEKSVAATKTFSSQLYALLMLAIKLSDVDYSKELISLSEKIDSNIKKIDILTSKFAPKYLNMKSGFVLSRGITYAIALEATLKLQETCYIQMKGYATSDFYHGPMAMVNELTPVIMYCAKYNFEDLSLRDNYNEDEIKGIEKMISLNAPVLLITDNDVLYEKYNNKIDVAYLPESKNECFSMFNFALFAQLFACKISCGIGNNPDSPRALNKVTITK